MSSLCCKIMQMPLRRSSAKYFSINTLSNVVSVKRQTLIKTNNKCPLIRNLVRNVGEDSIEPAVLEKSSINFKKKVVHKKALLENLTLDDGQFLTMAYATANSYDLSALKEAIIEQKLYAPDTLEPLELGNVLIASAMYSVGSEPREIIFFREGAVVFWNCTEMEVNNVLDFLKRFESDRYPQDVIQKEKEVMKYSYKNNAKRCFLQESCFVLKTNTPNSLERYTFSHAMMQSTRLGAFEAQLEALAATVRLHTAAMVKDGTSNVEKKEVVHVLGELFSLRHRVNVESDLLDIPDFYWEEEELERLYSDTVAYFTIPRRTRVLNERVAHCVELLELLSSWAADRHHVRLEWMIIILIMAELFCELVHFVERYGPTEDIEKKKREKGKDE